jgi:hypothetical protein
MLLVRIEILVRSAKPAAVPVKVKSIRRSQVSVSMYTTNTISTARFLLCTGLDIRYSTVIYNIFYYAVEITLIKTGKGDKGTREKNAQHTFAF